MLKRSGGIHLGSETPKETTTETKPGLKQKEEVFKPEIRSQWIEMLVFEGGNPEGWVFHSENFFSMHQHSEMEKLDVATLSFDGEALAYFQWEDKR